ncbi:uncharacterized protein G2W53_011566 [Senna tora]|uniref:Uncharacterized protein n=1 Tax=Senna tora TaxID=362788 RepID=A0A834X1Q3_9FABA|nr:uncharacterized protein G2W53_011566 [Senna tora]
MGQKMKKGIAIFVVIAVMMMMSSMTFGLRDNINNYDVKKKEAESNSIINVKDDSDCYAKCYGQCLIDPLKSPALCEIHCVSVSGAV